MNFFPLSWHEYVEQHQQVINVFGWIEDMSYCSVCIYGFTPFIFIKLGADTGEAQVKRLLQASHLRHEKVEEVRRRGLYSNYLKGEERYCFISFQNSIHRAYAVKALKGKFLVCENKASPSLQLTSVRNINLADWFRIMVSAPEVEKRTSCAFEFRLDYREVFPCDQKPSFLPTPTVLAYDIETYAHDVNVFPDGKHPEDVIFQISMVLAKPSQPRRKILLTLGTPAYDILDEDVEIFSFQSEAKLLLHYATLVRILDPQILIGYNTFGFDNQYMIERAKYLFILDDFSRHGCTREKSEVFSSNWSSSAYSSQMYCYLKLKGRIHVDLMQFVRREFKLDSYKLNSVAMHFVGAQKDPLNHYHIRECYLKGMQRPTEESKALAYVGMYCVKDSTLVLDLYDHLRFWEANVSMANVCHTSIVDVLTHGQTFKIFCQVYSYCAQHRIVVENDLYQSKADEFVEGAHVLDPVPGLHHNVVSFDFASLYPSIIISHNIDFSTFVQPDDKVDDSECHVVEWEEHYGCACEGAKKIKQLRDGSKVVACRPYRVRWLREPKGVIPTIIEHLLAARAEVRREMKQWAPDSVEYNLLNQRQLAFKASANSMYGAFASRFGSLQFLIAGMSITAIGRRSIQQVALLMETKHNANVIYGDSVTGDTPILIRTKDGIRYIPIESLPVQWHAFRDGKLRATVDGVEVWSDQGWTPIQYIMAHLTRKQLVRVRTPSGYVTVTEDHSLLRDTGVMCCPAEVKRGDALLHCAYPTLPENETSLLPEIACLHGRLYSDCQVVVEQILNSNTMLRRAFLRGVREHTDPLTTRTHPQAAALRLMAGATGADICVQSMEWHYVGETWVFDLETANHHFAAGVGTLVVHNTDSNYVKFRTSMPPAELEAHCLEVARQVSATFPAPMRLDFEGKIYELYFLFTKKRYIYKMYGKEGLTVSGVLLKRRDHSAIVKEIYKDLVDCCLRGAPEHVLWHHFYQNMMILLAGYRNAEMYAIGRSVKTIDAFDIHAKSAQKIHFGCYVISKFADDEKKQRIQLKKKGAANELDFYYKSLPNHVQLALKMRGRGQTIQNGSRLSFLYIKGDKRALTVDKMEDLEYFQWFYDNSAIDTAEYLRLLCERPLTELFNVYLRADHTKFFTNIWKAAAARNALNDEYKQQLLNVCVQFEN